MKKKKSLIAIAVIIAATIVLTLIFYSSGEWNPFRFSTRDVGDYGDLISQLRGESRTFSQLAIFPQETFNKDESSFSYSANDIGLDDTIMMVLTAVYDDAGHYMEEINRLEGISVTWKGKTNRVKVVTDKAQNKVILAIYEPARSYEFAVCDDSTKTITYLYSRYYDHKKLVASQIEKIEPMDENYSVYKFPVGGGYYIKSDLTEEE